MLNLDVVSKLFYCKGGVLYRKISASKNTKAGDIAGYLSAEGYWRTRIKNKAYLNHRIIYLLHHGWLPRSVDHIDLNRSNNRIGNLRAATNSGNQQNRGVQKNNTSGVKGVSWDKKLKKWTAHCCTDGKQKGLGCFSSIYDAAKSLEEYRAKHHGEFANNG